MFQFYSVPEIDFADIIPLDPPEPESDFAPGDDVLVNGKNGAQYNGFVKAVDTYQGLVLVRIWDHEVRGYHTAWWKEKFLAKETATPDTSG